MKSYNSSRNEGRSVVAKWFTRILKNRIFSKYMTAISKGSSINNLSELVDEYNNIVHRSFQMKPADVKAEFYIKIAVTFNTKQPKFEAGDHVRP